MKLGLNPCKQELLGQVRSERRVRGQTPQGLEKFSNFSRFLLFSLVRVPSLKSWL